MIRNVIRRAAHAVAPQFALDRYHHIRLVKRAQRLSKLTSKARESRAYCDALWRFSDFSPLQKKSEVLRLVEIIRLLSPSTVCEIGAGAGGTSFLFAAASASDAIIVSLDAAFDRSREAAIQHFARKHQKIVCLKGDSQNIDTLRAVEASLEGRSLDFLFIDGDHTYYGVSTDFRLYSPLVRVGGIIAFHDIVPDFRTRYGTDTGTDVGGVPEFWTELKYRCPSVEEIIEDPAQDGYGIGVLYWHGRAFEPSTSNDSKLS